MSKLEKNQLFDGISMYQMHHIKITTSAIIDFCDKINVVVLNFHKRLSLVLDIASWLLQADYLWSKFISAILKHI